ncbi:MAG: AraC family transcriptional regulator [Phaeodactylibacter sp.]|nr:AraC family transcriptional regulator [Phaeodactylibacter sp.]MCB9291602.1 AraC family transcriptional regulator [Lewinellaceae bacterium]
MDRSTKSLNHEPLIETKKNWLGKLNAIISDQLHDPNLTIPKIAEELFMSERQFYRRVKQETGLTPNQYLQVARLAKAKELLREKKGITIKETALSVGFSRPDYFSKLFEAYFGMRPVVFLRDGQ